MEIPTFEQFAEFIRHATGCSSSRNISYSTRFEKDLGITGDDGIELLSETEKKYGVLLFSEEDGCRKTFNLASNEYLFNSEGFNPFSGILNLLRGEKDSIVREFTVGALYDAVCQAAMKPGSDLKRL